MKPLLPFDAPLGAYAARADELLVGQRAREAEALGVIARYHPRYRTKAVPWLARAVGPEELAAAPFEREDARLVLARVHDFLDWAALAEWVEAVARAGAARRFEAAVEALVSGDRIGLAAALEADGELVRARSTRRTCFDPPRHAATLLHYVAANGVEAPRQRTPPNVVELARLLLEAGAEVDARAHFYGRACTTLHLLVSSSPPAQAGVQGELAELLADHGADLEGSPEGESRPLITALAFGFCETAERLARRGARSDDLVAAAGLGGTTQVARNLPGAESAQRHAALALAAQLGRTAVVELLLDAGEDPDRYNPEGFHAHATPLHQAVCGGHLAVVRLLIERGARLDLADRIYHGSPLGWARHCGRAEVERYLLARGAS